MISRLLTLEHYQHKPAWRLHRVSLVFSQWDEYDCAAAMPADLQPPVRPPQVERATLKALQGMLIDRLGEIELALAEAWGGRRN